MPPPDQPPGLSRGPIQENQAEGAPALPLQLELPVARPAPAQAAAAAERARPSVDARRWAVRIGAVAALAGLVAAVVVALVLPWYVRRRCVAEAAAHGIALSIDGVSIGAGGFRLTGARASSSEVPGAKVTAPEIDVETSGLSPETMTVRGAELTLSGGAAALGAALARWRSSPRGGQQDAWTPSTVVVDGSRVVWQSPLGDAARVEASGLHLEWRPRGAELHARSDAVLVAVPGGQLGPWRIDVDRAPGTSRVRVAFDPAVPDACTVLVVGDDDRTTSVDVEVPRSPLAHLGVPTELLRVRGKDLQLALTAHYGAEGPTRGEISAKGGLYGMETPGLPRPLDVAWEASAAGDPDDGIGIDHARLAAGPLVGTITGTFKRFGDGFRLDLAWQAAPVPCAAFDAPLGPGQPFDIAYALRQLAETAGLTRVKGTVAARGTLAFDSRDLGATRVGFAPDVRCQVALFGP